MGEAITLEKNAASSETEALQQLLHDTFLTFWLGKELYGISIADVVQITNIQEIVPVPNMPSCVKGIVNLRGSVMPVVDMRLRLGKEEIPYEERTCIIITSFGGRYAGLIVDSIDEVLYVAPEEQIAPPRGRYDTGLLEGIATLQRGTALLLDSQKLFGADEINDLFETSARN